MVRPIRFGGRLDNAHPLRNNRRTHARARIEIEGMRKIRGRMTKIAKELSYLQSRQFRRNVGEFGKRALKRRTREFAKNPTGSLENSWRFRSRSRDTASNGGTSNWSFFSDLIYAQIHDTGGIIRPKKARALTIPQTSIAKRIKKGPRFYPGRLRPTPWGLVDLQGTTQYVWAQAVRIPRTDYIKKAQADIDAHVNEMVRLRIRKGLRGRVTT